MYNSIMQLAEKINSVVWGVPTVMLLIGTGVFLSFRLNFFQFTNLKLWISNTAFKIFEKKAACNKSKSSLTPIQAISTALASTIGTGNVAGVAAAISFGGPGAVFWMWFSAFFGMITSYSENVLGFFYRKRNNLGQWTGGPMIYINEGLKSKKHLSFLSSPLSAAYCIFLIGSSLGIGNMVQTNSAAESIKTTFGLPYMITSILISLITYLIISKGINRIGRITEKLVPFMALFYIASTAYILISNSESIGYVFSSIVENAFNIKSASGGLIGIAFKKCVLTGFKRGVFSNEAGLGASVTVNSCSLLKEPCEQGMWGIFGVFTDTILICSLTAFALLSTSVDAYNIDYAIKNINNSPKYVYITPDITTDTTRIHITDKYEKHLLKIEKINNSYRLHETEDVTYANIMKITGIYDESYNLTDIRLEEIEGISLMSLVFEETFGAFSSIILSVTVVLFSFSTVIGWYFYGAKAIEFLTKRTETKRFNLIYALSSFIGGVMKLDPVWIFSDIFNALMAIPNLIALISLSDVVKAVTGNYLIRRNKKDVKPIINAYDD